MRFTQHIQTVLQKAGLRHGVMARLARSTWGHDSGIMRSAHATLLTSLTSYALAVVGSGAHDKMFQRIGTQSTNISARRITGVARSARIEVLHMAAGLWAIQNQYLQHIALLFSRSLEATRCSLTARLDEWLCKVYNMPHGFPPSHQPSRPLGLRQRTVAQGIYEWDMAEEWFRAPLATEPKLDEDYETPSVYNSNTKLLRTQPHLRTQLYSFQGVGNWQEAALQILSASGWRPDCTRPAKVNFDRAIPPGCKPGAALIDGGTDNMTWLSDKEIRCAKNLLESTTGILDIQEHSFYKSSIGLSSSYMCTPRGAISTQGWVLGVSNAEYPHPAYVREAPAAHALRLAQKPPGKQPRRKPSTHNNQNPKSPVTT